LWYKEGRLGTRAVGEPAGVTGSLKAVCQCVSGNLWPLNGYLVSQEKMEVLSVRKGGGDNRVGDMKRRKWVKGNRRKVEEEIREKGRMEGKSRKLGKHNRRKRGTEKKRRDSKWRKQSEEGTGKGALQSSVYNRLLIWIVPSGS